VLTNKSNLNDYEMEELNELEDVNEYGELNEYEEVDESPGIEESEESNKVSYIASPKAPGENSKYGSIYFPYTKFSTDTLALAFSKVFKLNTNYSLIIKIGTRSNSVFYMCGPQVGIIVKDNHDMIFYYHFYSYILERINCL